MSVKPITDPQLMFPNPQVVKNDGTSSIAFGGLGIFLWIALLALLRFGFGIRYSEALGAALLCVCFAVPAILHYRWVRRTVYHLSSEGLRVIRNGQTLFESSWQALRFEPRGLFTSSFWVIDGAGRRFSVESLGLSRSGAHVFNYIMALGQEQTQSVGNSWPARVVIAVYPLSAAALIGCVVISSNYQSAAVEHGGSNWVLFGLGALLTVIGLLTFLTSSAHLLMVLEKRFSKDFKDVKEPGQLAAFKRKFHGNPPRVVPEPGKRYRLKWEDLRDRESRYVFDKVGALFALMGVVGLVSAALGLTAKPIPPSSRWIMLGIVAVGAFVALAGRLGQRRRVHLCEATLTWDSAGNVTVMTNTGRTTFRFERNGRYRAKDGTWCVIDTRYLEEVSRS